MTGSAPRSDHAQQAWQWPEARPARVAHALAEALRWALRLCGFAGDALELRMSREWLEEHRRRPSSGDR